MRFLTIPAAFAGALAANTAMAETSTPAFAVPGATTGKPIGLEPSNTMAPPTLVAPTELASGDNKLTEAQARARIEATGFSDVTGLVKDANGIWRAKAKLGDRFASIGLDYKGNIAAQ